MNKEFEASKHAKAVIRIRTKHPDRTYFDGIVIENNRQFVLIQEIDDFEPDGITVIPKKWITGIRNGPYEQCTTQIFHANSTLNASRHLKLLVSAKTLAEIIVHLNAKKIWPAVELIYKRDASLYLGQITEVSNNAFKMHCYDASGKWEKEYELEYREIFKIEIDSKYVRHFNDFMRTKRKAV